MLIRCILFNAMYEKLSKKQNCISKHWFNLFWRIETGHDLGWLATEVKCMGITICLSYVSLNGQRVSATFCKTSKVKIIASNLICESRLVYDLLIVCTSVIWIVYEIIGSKGHQLYWCRYGIWKISNAIVKPIIVDVLKWYGVILLLSKKIEAWYITYRTL